MFVSAAGLDVILSTDFSIIVPIFAITLIASSVAAVSSGLMFPI